MTTPVFDPRRESWQEIISNRPEVMLTAAEVFKTHLVLFEREGGLPFLRIVDLASAAPTFLATSHRIEFAEPAYNASIGDNPEFDATHLRFQYESFVTPRSILDYDIRTRERILRKQQPILGGYDPAQYVSERLRRPPDGTSVPLRSSIEARHAARHSAAPPLRLRRLRYLMPVHFSSNRLSLLDRGVIMRSRIFAAANETRRAGRMRQSAIPSPILWLPRASHRPGIYFAAETRDRRRQRRWTSWALHRMRPTFSHRRSHVPSWMVSTMLDASLPLTVGEYESGAIQIGKIILK
jgi:oligopeptidase B